VWELCDGKRSLKDINTLLGDAFPDQADEIRQDVEAVVDRLAAEGALQFPAAT
jgi:hypothetical protein